MKWYLRWAIPATIVVLGASAFGRANADDDEPQPITYSFDTGNDASRVYATCVGADAVYQMGNTDEWRIIGASDNCAEGGFLLDPANDLWLREQDKED